MTLFISGYILLSRSCNIWRLSRFYLNNSLLPSANALITHEKFKMYLTDVSEREMMMMMIKKIKKKKLHPLNYFFLCKSGNYSKNSFVFYILSSTHIARQKEGGRELKKSFLSYKVMFIAPPIF